MRRSCRKLSCEFVRFAIAMRSNDLEILPIEATDSTAETLADDSLGHSRIVAGNSGNNLVVRRDIVENK